MRPPHQLRTATGAIAGLTSIISLLVLALDAVERAAVLMGFVPLRFGGGAKLWPAIPAMLTPLSATLVHASLLHLAGNLLMLMWCGLAVERVLGARGVLLLYAIGAYVAASAQFLVGPHSDQPMIGASGAISALIGAFALSYGQQKSIVRSRILNRWLNVAWLMVAWIVIQLGFGYLMGTQGMLLATPAHIGGFIAGLAMQRPLLLWRYRNA
ncbi:MAG: rhomboid family intramembrane serine protease [Pseudomonadota bacterium]|nr:rhomboid family intramembrane serine protease [Pseudomonadota bacterium]